MVGSVHLGVQAVLCRIRAPGWPARGDGVEALATLVGHVAPLGRRPDGRLAWRNPLVNAAHVRSVKPLTKGRYRLHLEDGSAVESSRGYRDEIRHRFLAGAT